MYAFSVRKIMRKRKEKKKQGIEIVLLIGVRFTIAWTWRGWSRKLRNSNWFSLAMHSSAITLKCSWRSSSCSSRGSGDGCTGWKSVFLVNLVCLVLEKNYSTKSLLISDYNTISLSLTSYNMVVGGLAVIYIWA